MTNSTNQIQLMTNSSCSAFTIGRKIDAAYKNQLFKLFFITVGHRTEHMHHKE